MQLGSLFVGRASDCATLDELVGNGGIVTLLGPGGVGKTRLVSEYVTGWTERTGGRATVAVLADVARDAGDDAVVAALGFESLDAAIVVLTERGGIVVLDNCEHVLDSARRLAVAISTAVPDLVVVATSRALLGADREQVLVVEPLGLPGVGGVDAADAPAVQLFLARAAAAGAALEPSPALLADVAELCRRLDGLPLAIELAAARARAIAPSELLAAVGDRIGMLHRGLDVGGRHDSMRAAIDLSMTLLPPGELGFFRRLAVFSGPFDLRLAHAVAGDPDADRLASIDALTGLVDRSLVAAETDGSSTRYRLLELLREHAHTALGDAGELEAVEERFVAAMVAAADRIVADALARWDPVMLGAASTQYANLVRAVELCLERDRGPARAFRLLLPMFAAIHEGRPNDVLALGRRVLAAWPDRDAPWRAEALAVLASAAAIAGRIDEVEPLAISVVDDPGASPIATALADRAWGLAVRGSDPLDAARHFELASTAAARAGAASIEREAQVFRAGELDLAGERGRALGLLDEVEQLARAADDVFVLVPVYLVRARIDLRAGDVAAAESELRAARVTSGSMGQPWWTAAILRTAACVAAMGPAGWGGSGPRWREAVDFGAGLGALGEVAITLRTAACVALELGEPDAADLLWSAAPRSTTITVLPELFPERVAELAERGGPPPSGAHLMDALGRVRTALGGRPEPTPDAGPTESTLAELVSEGEAWRISFAGHTVRMRDMKGLGDLAVLFARPGVEVHVLELMGAHDVGAAPGPTLDVTARRAYQARIGELQRDIDEARADNDPARADRAEVELDALVEQLSEAFGLGGRHRPTGSSAERARTAVTYRVRAAIKKCAQLHPDLGRHLDNAVRTGTWCSYRPESDVGWVVETHLTV